MQHTYNYASKLDLKLVVCGLHARSDARDISITRNSSSLLLNLLLTNLLVVLPGVFIYKHRMHRHRSVFMN
jgi:hypothetical protein